MYHIRQLQQKEVVRYNFLSVSFSFKHVILMARAQGAAMKRVMPASDVQDQGTYTMELPRRPPARDTQSKEVEYRDHWPTERQQVCTVLWGLFRR